MKRCVDATTKTFLISICVVSIVAPITIALSNKSIRSLPVWQGMSCNSWRAVGNNNKHRRHFVPFGSYGTVFHKIQNRSQRNRQIYTTRNTKVMISFVRIDTIWPNGYMMLLLAQGAKALVLGWLSSIATNPVNSCSIRQAPRCVLLLLSMMADNLMVHIGAIPIGSHGCFHNSWWADSMVYIVSIRTLAGTGHNGLLDSLSHTLEEVGAVSTASTVLLLGHDVVVVLVGGFVFCWFGCFVRRSFPSCLMAQSE